MNTTLPDRAGRYPRSAGRWRLIDAVIAVAIAAGALACVREVKRPNDAWLGTRIGVILAPVSACLAGLFVVRAIRGQAAGRHLSAWERTWRLGAALLLAAYSMQQGIVLRLLPDEPDPFRLRPVPLQGFVVPRNLTPACGVLGAIGIALGCGPVRRQTAGPQRGWVTRTSRIVLAGCGGWLVLGMAASWISVVFDSIDFLVLLAVDGVAMARQLGSTMDRAPLDARSHAALGVLLPTALWWTLLLAWLTTRGTTDPKRRLVHELAPGVVLAIVTLGLGLHLWCVAIPRFSPEYAWAATWLVALPGSCAALLLALMVLAAGLAARAAGAEVAEPVDSTRMRWAWVVSTIVRCTVIVLAAWVILDTLPQIIRLALPDAPFVPAWVRQRPPPLLWSFLPPPQQMILLPVSSTGTPTPILPWWVEYEELWSPQSSAEVVAFTGALGLGVATLIRRRGRRAAFDAVGQERATLVRFAVYWASWHVALCVALPIIGLGALLIRVEHAAHLWIW